MNDLVSIVVPVYNVEKYLEACVHALIHQTYTNLQIILVNDGSKDQSAFMCDRFRSLDSRIEVIHKLNGGLSSARNAAFPYLKGKYLMYIDSDDTLALDSVEVALKAMKEQQLDIVAFALNEKETFHQGPLFDVEVVDAKKALYYIFSEQKMTTSANAKLYDVNLWKDIRFPEGKIYEDYATIYKVFLKASKIGVSTLPKYYYRPNPTSITGVQFSSKRMQYFEVTQMIQQDIQDIYPELIKEIDNRSTRYATAFYRDYALANCQEENTRLELVHIIRSHIMSYVLQSHYVLKSKLYALCVACMPKVAMKVFKR